MARMVSFKSGNIVYRGDNEYEVVEAVSMTEVAIRDTSSGEHCIADINDLSSKPANPVGDAVTPLELLSEKEQKKALERFEMIKPLIKPYSCHSRKEVEKRSNELGVHYTTLYRIMREYDKTGSIASLVLKITNRGGKGGHRLSPLVEAVVDDIIQKKLNDKTTHLEKMPVSKIHSEIDRKCIIAGLDSPTWVTVKKRMQEALKKKGISRKGRRKTRISKSNTNYFPDGMHPLDAVQIDHTPLDIILVDEKFRKPIGKAYLTVAIDTYSRMVMGFKVSLDHPSIYSVGQTLIQCILTKKKFLERIGIKLPWDIHGIMKTIYADNAGEFRTEDFTLFLSEYNIEFSWRPVATPNYGGHIERLCKTLNQAVHTLPGSTFSNVNERGDYDSDEEACFTIDEIERWVAVQIIEIYHNEEHSALGMTPNQKYTIGINGDETTMGIGIPDMVEDQERLKIFLLPCIERTIQKEGVSLDTMQYFHDILRQWVGLKDDNNKSRLFIFRRDPMDISRIYFYDPDRKQHFPIPYRDLNWPPMTLWDLHAARRYLKENKVRHPNPYQIVQALETQTRITEEAISKTKAARRQQEAARHRKKANKPVYSQENQSRQMKPDHTMERAIDDPAIFADIKPSQGIKVLKSKRGE